MSDQITVKFIGGYRKIIQVYEIELEAGDPGDSDYPVVLSLHQEWEPGSENEEQAVWYFAEQCGPEPSELEFMGLTEDEFIEKCKAVIMGDIGLLVFTGGKNG